ncbi:MarR family transcriptional regulator [Vibrio sp. SM6]|uniref:MarR family transcriptional regulator n=1 Tax=Vibrio agarilyticus TaxID=2726741 RepID=A0A7X8TNR9_9VIBR|nr:MarR family transcriptional regulator [Vibrio agarilyticus]
MSEKTSLDTIFKLVHSLKRNLQDRINALELAIAPMHVRVLKIISKKPNCTAMDIAHLLDRDKAQVTRLLNNLFEQALIVKEPNPEDKRSQCLGLTQNGQMIVAKLAQIDAAMLREIQQGISEQDLECFQRIAKQMTSNLSDF